MTPEHAILTCLDRLGSLLLPEQTLHIEINLMLPRAATVSETRDALLQMESRGWVAAVPGELTGRRLWRITPLGRSILNSHTV